MTDDDFTYAQPPGSGQNDELKRLIVEYFEPLPDEIKLLVLEVWQLMKLTCPPKLYLN